MVDMFDLLSYGLGRGAKHRPEEYLACRPNKMVYRNAGAESPLGERLKGLVYRG
jgi:hypothetical protein